MEPEPEMRRSTITTRNVHEDENATEIKLELGESNEIHALYYLFNTVPMMTNFQVVKFKTVGLRYRIRSERRMARKQRKSKSKAVEVSVSEESVVASPVPVPVEPEKKGKRGATNGEVVRPARHARA